MVHPISRLRELLGPDFRPDFSKTLAERMHLQFDQVAHEIIPDDLSHLVEQLTPGNTHPATSAFNVGRARRAIARQIKVRLRLARFGHSEGANQAKALLRVMRESLRLIEEHRLIQS